MKVKNEIIRAKKKKEKGKIPVNCEFVIYISCFLLSTQRLWPNDDREGNKR